MDEVLNAVDSVASEHTGDDAVIAEWESSVVDLSVSSLIDDLGDHASGWITIGDEWLDHLDHVPGGLVQLDEDSVMELSQSQELQNLLGLGGKLSDTI